MCTAPELDSITRRRPSGDEDKLIGYKGRRRISLSVDRLAVPPADQ